MSAGLSRIFRDSLFCTLAIDLCLLLLIGLFCPHALWLPAGGGLLWGSAVALAGFWMICSMADGLTDSIKAEKSRGRTGYFGRYAFYAACLFFGAWIHLSVLAMLGGILVQKASLVLYALKERKDCR